MSSEYAVCEKCEELKKRTKHHVFPKRWFGRKGIKINLCRDCHDKIEKIIPKYQRMPKKWYSDINSVWLGKNIYHLGGI
jgi:hypothetical protein